MFYLVEAMCVSVTDETIRVRSLVLRHEQDVPLSLQGVMVKADENERAQYTDISKLPKEPPHIDDRLQLIYGDDSLEAKTLIVWFRLPEVVLPKVVIKVKKRRAEEKVK